MVIVVFEFIADRPVLDFVATLAERGTTNEEKLATPADLIAWATEAGIVHDVRTLSEEQLRHAQRVRDAIFGLIASAIDHTPPRDADRATVNSAAAKPKPVFHLDSRGTLHRTGGLEAMLAALATDCLDLIDSPDRTQLHWCDDHRCTRPFIDRSHGRRRRWCGMKGCGDRAKAAAYRQRQRERTQTVYAQLTTDT